MKNHKFELSYELISTIILWCMFSTVLFTFNYLTVKVNSEETVFVSDLERARTYGLRMGDQINDAKTRMAAGPLHPCFWASDARSITPLSLIVWIFMLPGMIIAFVGSLALTGVKLMSDCVWWLLTIKLASCAGAAAC